MGCPELPIVSSSLDFSKVEILKKIKRPETLNDMQACFYAIKLGYIRPYITGTSARAYISSLRASLGLHMKWIFEIGNSSFNYSFILVIYIVSHFCSYFQPLNVVYILCRGAHGLLEKWINAKWLGQFKSFEFNFS